MKPGMGGKPLIKKKNIGNSPRPVQTPGKKRRLFTGTSPEILKKMKNYKKMI